MVNRFFKIKKHITIITIAAIDAVSVCISIILDRRDIKKAFKGVTLFKFLAKSRLTNGSNKKREKIEKNAATKLHKTITQSLSL
jgi:hypothetical protein